MKHPSLRVTAPLVLAVALMAPAYATNAAPVGNGSLTDSHTAAAAQGSYKAPKVRVKITLSPDGDRLTGARIPIKGYLSGNTERGRKTIELQQWVGGTWKTKAAKKQWKLGAYSLPSQRVAKPGKVKYRTTVSLKGKVLSRSNTITVNVVKRGDTPNDTTAPAIPTGLAATPGDTKVTLTWNAVGDTDLDHYTVYWSLSGQPASEVDTTSTSYTVTGLTNDTEYYFSVQAVDKSDNKSTKAEVVAATPVSGTPTDTTAPPVPTGLTATASDGQVSLKWDAVSAPDLAGYTVFRSTSGQTAVETNVTGTSLNVTGLSNGTEYFFTVISYDTAGNKSAKSNEAAATPESGTPTDTTAPPVPTGLTATAGDGQVSLSWAAVSAPDLAGYTVFRSTSGQTAVETNVTGTSLNVTGLSNGTEYFFTVISYDTAGNKSAKSNEAAATPAAEAPLTQQRVIDGEQRCHVLEIQTLNQERTSTDGGATWSDWVTVSEGVRAAAAADCLDVSTTIPPGALLPDLRMRDLDVCSAAEKAANGGDCFGIYDVDGKRLLKFPIITVNVGEGPSEVIADRSAASASEWRAYQTFYVGTVGDKQRDVSVYSPNAEFYFAGDGHNHWHIRDFDSYRILDESGTEVATAEKHGYCLEDNTDYGGMRGQVGVPTDPVYEHSKMCGLGLPNALTIVHGMSRGWGDTYPSSLPDQGVDITGLPDGTYTVEVTADDRDAVVESDDSNNTASIKVTIAGTEATVVPGSATGGLP